LKTHLLLVIALIFGISPASNARTDAPGQGKLSASCRVESISEKTLNQDESSTGERYFNLKYRLTLKNRRKESIYIPKFRLHIFFFEITELPSNQGRGLEEVLFFESFGDSRTYSEEWQQYRKEIFERGFSKTNCYEIGPQAEIEIELIDFLRIPKEKNSDFPPRGHYSFLKSKKSLFIKFVLCFWPTWFEYHNEPKTGTGYDFAKKIRRKWRKQGYFHFENVQIQSFPLSLPD
jgi:hypothetical protein